MQKNYLKLSLDIAKLFFKEVYTEYLVDIFPRSPTTINFQANDICNSKCTMCNIWQRKRDIELDPRQLGQILNDSYFSKVKHVGITGGEPTLRKDLHNLFEVFINNCPKLEGLSTITNAINSSQVIERVEKCIEVCNKNNISFQ